MFRSAGCSAGKSLEDQQGLGGARRHPRSLHWKPSGTDAIPVDRYPLRVNPRLRQEGDSELVLEQRNNPCQKRPHRLA